MRCVLNLVFHVKNINTFLLDLISLEIYVKIF